MLERNSMYWKRQSYHKIKFLFSHFDYKLNVCLCINVFLRKPNTPAIIIFHTKCSPSCCYIRTSLSFYRPPFDNNEEYIKKRNNFVSLGMNLIGAVQNDSLLHTQELVMRCVSPNSQFSEASVFCILVHM